MSIFVLNILVLIEIIIFLSFVNQKMLSEIDKDRNPEPQNEREELNDSRANENDLGTHVQPKIIKIVKMVTKRKKRKRDEQSDNEKGTISLRFYWREGDEAELFYGYRKRLKDQNGMYKARIYCNMQRAPRGQKHCLVSFIARCTTTDEDSPQFIDPTNWQTEINLNQALHQYIRFIFMKPYYNFLNYF